MKAIVVNQMGGEYAPSGAILFWSGPSYTIPTGWTLYSSAADAFIMGTNPAGISLTKTGSNSHLHTNSNVVANPAHGHTATVTVGGDSDRTGVSQASSGATGVSAAPHYHNPGTPTVGSVDGHVHSAANTGSTDHTPVYRRYYLMKGGSAPIPVGAIMLWPGALSTIPAGWRHCDGSTQFGVTVPDIRSCFLYVPSADGQVGASGGSDTHNHNNPASTGSGGDHVHPLSSGNTGGPTSGATTAYTGSGKSIATSTHYHSGISGNSGPSGTHSHTMPALTPVTLWPPFVKLFYIIKVY